MSKGSMQVDQTRWNGQSQEIQGWYALLEAQVPNQCLRKEAHEDVMFYGDKGFINHLPLSLVA